MYQSGQAVPNNGQKHRLTTVARSDVVCRVDERAARLEARAGACGDNAHSRCAGKAVAIAAGGVELKAFSGGGAFKGADSCSALGGAVESTVWVRISQIRRNREEYEGRACLHRT
jgi:hypothetical protein